MLKMKIGVSEPFDSDGRQGFCDAEYGILKKYGFDFVDLGAADTDTELYGADEDAALSLMREIKARHDSAGIKIWQMHGPWRYPPMDVTEEDRAERLDKMKRAVLLAECANCRYLVVHPLMPDMEDLVHDLTDETYRINLSFMRELAHFAAEHSVVICLENMPMRDLSLSKPLDILAFVREIDSPNFKICFDSGHVAVFPGLSPAGELLSLGDYVKVLHIHDNDGIADRHRDPGLGVIDWQAFAVALEKIDFDGVFSLEVGLSADKFESRAKALREICDKILG